ncbi:MAG TPA: hypothetical protein VEC16_04825 [Alphaproteobacteria bacterium]|nr:hypothetical protein [Alphaproteobacteria bacterium]
MEILTYLLLLLASFSGTLFAIFLSNICIEEINDVSSYVMTIIPFLISAIMFIVTEPNGRIFAAISAIIMFILLWFFRGQYNPRILYISSSFLLYLSTIVGKILEVSIIIFIYGMLLATFEASNILVYRENRNIKKSENIKLAKTIFSKYTYFILAGILFYALFEYILKI